jgi:uncharacterized ubiquitin-like protein YukD
MNECTCVHPIRSPANKVTYMFAAEDTLTEVKTEILKAAHFQMPQPKQLTKEERSKIQLMIKDELVTDDTKSLKDFSVAPGELLTYSLSVPLKAKKAEKD